jgi:hypothetical protein
LMEKAMRASGASTKHEAVERAWILGLMVALKQPERIRSLRAR